MTQIQKFERLFNPRSIAIVGASDVPGKVGNMIARNLLEYDYQGRVFFVNSVREKILEQPCYATLSDLPEDVDCAIVAVPAQFVFDVIAAGKEKCKNFVIISAGFGESGIEGHNREMQLMQLAKENDLIIMGPNCLGFVVPQININASFAPGMPYVGSIAFISQSGALAVAAMDKAREDHIGFSAVVSIGNEMLVTAADLVRYFVDDENTKTIALYMEGVVHGEDFLDAVRYARQKGKSVLVLKAGQTERAQQAIALHTGSLAGSDEIFDAALLKAGGIRMQSMEDVFVAMVYASHYAFGKGGIKSIGVVTNAGGPGVLVTDTIATLQHVNMSVLSKKTKTDLKKILPEAASVHNPIDLLGDADAARYGSGIQAAIRDKKVDIILILLTPQAQTPVMEIAQQIVALCQNIDKPVITSFVGGERVSEAISYLRSSGIVHYMSSQDALRTVDVLMRMQMMYVYPKMRKKTQERTNRMKKIVEQVVNRDVLYYEECVAVAQSYDISISSYHDITRGLSAQQKIVYPCVAKIDDPKILHKTDRGGVILPIRNLAELHRAQAHLLSAFRSRSARVIVQPLVPIKMELIIGMKRDPVFGVAVIVGLGGIYTEMFRMTELFIAPLTIAEIKNTLLSGKLQFLFTKVRGISPYHIDAVARCIMQVSLIGVENSFVQAIDINPFLVYNDDRKDIAIDFKMIIKK